MGFIDADPKKSGFPKVTPKLFVEALFALVDFAHVLVAGLIEQDLFGEVLQFELFVRM